MLGTDTAKQDLFLLVLGALAALLFYWIFSFSHPLNIADSSLGKDEAINISHRVLTGLGYMPVEEAYADFRVHNDMLDSLQAAGPIREVYTGREVRASYPVFHWHVRHRIQPEEWLLEMSETDRSEIEINTSISEEGRLTGLVNPDGIFPSRTFEPEILQHIFSGIEPHIPDLRPDRDLFNRYRFRFDRPQRDSERQLQFNDSRPNILGQSEAEMIARYHLDETGWNSENFQTESIELISLNQVDAARIIFSRQVENTGRSLTMTLDVLPTGSLIAMSYSDPDLADATSNWENLQSGALAVGMLIFILWVLILLYIRIKLRLIDTKLSVLVAVLAGFAFPALLLLNWAYRYFYSFDSLTLGNLSSQILALGILAAFSSVIYFVITAIGDSLTREYWIEKLRTFDLIRIGHFYNRPVGLVIVRSVAYSFIIAAAWALAWHLLPDNYISVNPVFRSGQTLLPFIHSLMLTFFIFLGITQAVFLIVIGKISSYSRNPVVIGLITALIFIIINPETISAGPDLTEIVLSGIAGFAAGLIFVKEDFLTTFLTLFFFGIHLLSSPGWVMSPSPDASIFYATTAMILAFLALGITGIYKGKPIQELPKYVPDYIIEMARDERMKQELQIARKVQESFLPGQTPRISGLDIAAACIPAYETGGDYYDFIELNNNRTAVIIGDVSGKGIEAAFYMTFTKGMLHALCAERGSSIEILSSINTLFRKNASPGTFISLIFGILNPEESTFCFSRAGHNPLLYYNSSAQKLEEFIPKGIGVGMTGEELFRKHITESTIKMNSGDIIVMFTDGIVEAVSHEETYYGDDRLHKIIRNNKNLTAEKIIGKLMDDLKNFGQGANQHDDMTILIIKKE